MAKSPLTARPRRSAVARKISTSVKEFKDLIVIKTAKVGIDDLDGDGDSEVVLDLKVGITISPKRIFKALATGLLS